MPEFCVPASSCRRPRCRPPQSASAASGSLIGKHLHESRASRAGDVSAYTRRSAERETEMPESKRTRPTASVAPPKPPLLVPHPPSAPLLPPAHVVDLMTVEGSAVFDAQWKAMEAKVVECPALADAMPEFRTTYDIEPYVGVSGFDDSSWPVIAADDLGARRGGGMVSFFWYRTKLTIPANAA